MKREIAAVVNFLKRLVKKGGKLESHKIDLFVERLAVALQEKFKGHWYPENPNKGQAYRCIRMNRLYRQDPELLRACRESGVQFNDLKLCLELALWVDPGEVSCRYGEHNPSFSVASFSCNEGDTDVAKVTSALERVTSDYHSGSSSDEESVDIPPHSLYNGHSPYQAMNPTAPTWHPKKMVPEYGILPRPHYCFMPHGRTQATFRPGQWVAPGFGDRPPKI
ncbi:protein BTG3 [Cyclopterus lumpus]|uniref:B-cell translocation gene 3 n=1 Tax=Cyclopterus lumpus TaxID=8103 RepID=A0A8C3AI79_CYCLU|nr:protein BTG3 [Cyclopterus lumpus]XP_034406050.1 protein BTG3 [Cyclopterus lumpus]